MARRRNIKDSAGVTQTVRTNEKFLARFVITDDSVNDETTYDIAANSIVDAHIGAHTSTKITITAKGQLNSTIVYNDQANTFGNFLQIFNVTTDAISINHPTAGKLILQHAASAQPSVRWETGTAAQNIRIVNKAGVLSVDTDSGVDRLTISQVGLLTIANNIIPNTDNAFSLGISTLGWLNIFITGGVYLQKETSLGFGVRDSAIASSSASMMVSPTSTFGNTICYGTAASGIDASVAQRFAIFRDGQIEWGPGGAGARDISLARLSAQVLIAKTLGTNLATAFIVSPVGTPISGETRFEVRENDTGIRSEMRLEFDHTANEYRIFNVAIGGGTLRPLAFFASATESFRIKTDADIQIESARKLWFGTDVDLFRDSPNILKTNDKFFSVGYESASGGLLSKEIQGNIAIQCFNINTITDNSFFNSPNLRFTARYDSNPAVGPITIVEGNLDIFHRMLSITPTSEIVFKIDAIEVLLISNAGVLKPASDIQVADAKNIILGTTTGTKIGTATTQKLGFFGKTPVVQPAAYTPTNVITDRAYDANATTIDELADVLGTVIADLQLLGLVG